MNGEWKATALNARLSSWAWSGSRGRTRASRSAMMTTAETLMMAPKACTPSMLRR